MSLWLVRAGKYSEYEEHFFTTNSIYLTWDRLEQTNLGGAKSFDDIKSIVPPLFQNLGHRSQAHYEQLDEDIRTELPLKRIWTMAVDGES
jgi:predicted Mrr-cat superfamily restriction endonuclease